MNTMEGIGIGTAAAGDVLGMIQGIGAGKRQQKRTKELMGIQLGNQQKLNAQQKEDSKEMWDYTNYENQRKHMEEAGLNVGMMYGGSGGGGATTSGTSSGTASGNSGAQEQIISGGNIGNIGMMSSQIELNKAQTEKLKAEANKIEGVDTDNVSANTALTDMNTKNAELRNRIDNESMNNILDTIKANRDKAVAESSTASTEANVNASTQSEQIEEIKARAINEAFKLAVMKEGIKLNEAQIENMAQQIAIGKFNANINAEFQGVDKVTGSQLNKLANMIYDYFGIREATETQKKIK